MIRKKTAIYLSNMIVLFSLGSCKHLDCNLPSFVDTFEAYRWLGYNEEKYEERRAKIMELLHNSEAETSATGTDSVPCIDFSLPYKYYAYCTNATYKNFTFTPTAENHQRIAYVEAEEGYGTNDSLKIYFPDSIQAKAFIDEARKKGFKFSHEYYYNFVQDFISKGELDPNDSCNSAEIKSLLNHARNLEKTYTTAYTDSIDKCAYGIRLHSESHKDVVVFHCEPLD